MEQYVRQVLLREHKANVKNMTPEQALEFKNTKRRLRKELKAEIKKTKNKDKSKNKKTMQEGTTKNISKDGVDG
jgi:F0F1-type ATP synthase assembly protein I